MNRRRFQAVKGTRDILPPESALWAQVEQTARRVFAAYNFQEIRLPLFEETELFARSVGTDTDIVKKEMYTLTRGLGPDSAELVPILHDPNYNLNDPASYIRFAGLLARTAAHLEPSDADSEDEERRIKRIHENVSRVFSIRQAPLDWDTFRSELFFDLANIPSKSISWRPEATASVVRAYIEHGLHTRPGLAKLYYIGPMFRRERPQKGRFRQFYQIGAEVLGPSDHPGIDAEIVELVLVFIERCGLPVASFRSPEEVRSLSRAGARDTRSLENEGVTLYVNSIGCSACRPKYVELLRRELQKVKAKLGPDSQRRIETNPLRVLDSKVEGEQAIIEKLPSILDHLCQPCRDHFQQFQQELKDRGIAYEINRRLVRGLDYYTRTTFEITAPGLGAQNAICGGGRYDGLSELLGGPPTKGIGWALGTDRLLLALQHAGVLKADLRPNVFIVWLGAAAGTRARQLARRLRDAGVSTELAYEEMKLKKALGRADQAGARYALIIGEDELAQGKFTLREMQSGTQRALSEEGLLRELAPSK